MDSDLARYVKPILIVEFWQLAAGINQIEGKVA